MLIECIGHRLLAGGALLFLSLPFGMQHAAAQGTTQVLTPFGYRDSTNVHRVQPGYDLVRMPDEHIRMENPKTGDHIDFPIPVSINPQSVPFTDTGWVTYASWYNTYRSPVGYFSTDWNVPYPPSVYSGQTLFQFNSIEPASGTAILQPVLQYGPSSAGGGKYWAVASWYVTGNQAYFTTLVPVETNQFLGGVIRLTAKRRSACSYTCDFYGINGTSLTVSNIPELVWCTETLEVYNVTQCAEFPKEAYSEMYGITISLRNGTAPSMNWTTTDAQTSCGTQTTVVTNGAVNGTVYIYY
jgi:hypothetical protein